MRELVQDESEMGCGVCVNENVWNVREFMCEWECFLGNRDDAIFKLRISSNFSKLWGDAKYFE